MIEPGQQSNELCLLRGTETGDHVVEVGDSLRSRLFDQGPARRRELNAEAAAVLFVQRPLHQALFFQAAQQGADGVSADAAKVAERGGRDRL